MLLSAKQCSRVLSVVKYVSQGTEVPQASAPNCYQVYRVTVDLRLGVNMKRETSSLSVCGYCERLTNRNTTAVARPPLCGMTTLAAVTACTLSFAFLIQGASQVVGRWNDTIACEI